MGGKGGRARVGGTPYGSHLFGGHFALDLGQFLAVAQDGLGAPGGEGQRECPVLALHGEVRAGQGPPLCDPSPPQGSPVPPTTPSPPLVPPQLHQHPQPVQNLPTSLCTPRFHQCPTTTPKNLRPHLTGTPPVTPVPAWPGPTGGPSPPRCHISLPPSPGVPPARPPLTLRAACSPLLLRVPFLPLSPSRAPSSRGPNSRGSVPPKRLLGCPGGLGPPGAEGLRLSLVLAFSFFLLPSEQLPAFRRPGTFSSFPAAPGFTGRRLIFTSPSGLPRRQGPAGERAPHGVTGIRGPHGGPGLEHLTVVHPFPDPRGPSPMPAGIPAVNAIT